MKNMALTNAMRELGAERDIYQVQRDLIRKQTEETDGSIRYAQRLQQNLSENCIHHLAPFEGYFILNRPKAIVSGDFYWVRQVDRKLLIAVADCTGHGVPGAFMSVLGITFLNDIVRYDHLTSPDSILFSLRSKVIESFSGDKQNEHTAKDGMDIALVSIDIDSLELQFAGAYNPLYIVRDTDLLCFNGDRMPISIHEKQNLPFTSHTVQLHKEDTLYLFSDGYVDQFGWRTGKKFKHAQFKQILLELNDVPIEAQKSVLDKTLNGWIGDLEQVDDIMILGLKI
jgi:serine phosphatase RsbU (regulator of sigma subunit)